MTHKKPNLRTLSVWAGEEKRDGWQRATQVPIVHSVSYGYNDLDYFDCSHSFSCSHITLVISSSEKDYKDYLKDNKKEGVLIN